MNFQPFLLSLSDDPSFKYYVYDKHKTFDLPVSVKLEFKTEISHLKSWGVSDNKDLAFFKAFVELVERAAIHNSCGILYKKNSLFSSYRDLNSISKEFKIPISNLYPDNSNGTGCGTSLSMAQRSALNELIERHTVLSCLILNIPPLQAQFDLSRYSYPAQFKLRFFYWKHNGKFVSICEAKEVGLGAIYAHACESSLKKSFKKSFEELVPNMIFADTYKEAKSPGSEIIPNEIASFANYWRFSGDFRMSEFLESNFEGDTSKWKDIPVLKDVFFSNLSLPKPFDNLKGILHCVRAISPQAQQLFFDNWKDSYVNPIIFRNYNLPRFPHLIA